MADESMLSRLELLVGGEAVRRLGRSRVVLFGLGGVGSWCAEALVRNGVERLTVVDSDVVAPSNFNRQLVATAKSLGAPKAEAMAARLAEVDPAAEITALRMAYGPATVKKIDLAEYDYVLDAIDTLNNKVVLIERALASGAVLFSALGASLKLDPTRMRTGSFWSVRGCPLGKHLRKRLRNRGVRGEFTCVYSDEVRKGAEIDEIQEDGHKRVNGSAVHVTAAFGLALAGLVVNHVVSTVS